VRIVALAGGIGGARFLRGLKVAVPEADITVIGNTGDDAWLFGLRVCPDLDTVMYTLGGGIHEEQGWGRRDESFRVKDELAAYGAQPQWFGLGDLDIATHVLRSQLLHAGASLTEVTAALCARWEPGVTLLPMSDTFVETHVVIGEGARLHASEPAVSFVQVGVEAARPTPQVLAALEAADVILLPPSNPVVSIGTILGVPGMRDAVLAARAPVVGLSPIVGGAPVRGMADACLTAIGVETSARAVGSLYGPLLGGWLVHTGDLCSVDGVEVREVPLLMTSLEATAAMAGAALELAASLG
jgi:LPPG:FO 2-phospho-L-lactate transferase